MRKLAATMAIALSVSAGFAQNNNSENSFDMETLNLTQEWDKTFPQSDKATQGMAAAICSA